MRYLVLLIVLFTTPLFLGCSDENSQALFEAHVATWIAEHPGNIVYSTASYITECGNCHGLDLRGSGNSPSCFSATFTGNGCHAAGPVPHPLDNSFGDAANHGPVAKADLTVCQACHSDNPTGGAGSYPQFNVGIFGEGCETCHTPGYAHPDTWAGPTNDRYHYSAGNIQQACTLCHGAALTSCNECHADAVVDFTLTCSSSSTRCHVMPPDGVNRIDHGTVADISDHDICLTCHGMKESAAGGTFSNVANYGLFDKQADVIGDHWDGNINMNSDTGYDQLLFGCTTAGCHGLAGHILSDSGLTVELGAYGDGNVPHPVGQDWLLPTGHVAAVDATCVPCHTLAGGGQDPACQDCHIQGDPLVLLNCTSCHSEPPGTAFTVEADRPDREGAHDKVANLTASTMDCSACHQGGGTGELSHYDRIDQTTPDYPADVNLVLSLNSISPDATYDTVGRTCSGVSCHGGQITPDWLTGSLDVETQCESCHSQVISEANSYNSGEHDKHVNDPTIFCTDCHNTTNLATNHFTNLANPAQWLDSAGATIGGGATSIGTYDDTTNSCSLTCHGETRTW